jgi:ABC-2 type transport system permease protein
MTQNPVSTYTPAFLEKLLGRNYKWWFLLQTRFKSRTSSFWNNALFGVGQMLILISTLITWWLANEKIIDFDLQQRWTYFIVGELFFSSIYTFAEMAAYDYIQGKYNKDLLRPQSFLVLKFFESYGEASFQNLIKVILLLILLCTMLISNQISFFDLKFFLATILLLPISLIILYLIGYIVACNGFFMTQINGVTLNYGFLLGFLSGRFFPLGLIFENFYLYLFNPFAFTFYHPMQIYLGKYSPLETFYVFLGGIAWSFVLYFLAKLIFKMVLKRNEAVGM